MHYHFPNHWSIQISVSSLSYDKALILKRSLILSNTNIKIWSKIWVWVLMYLKCFFSNPGRWTFVVILVYDTKMSKLTLCFSILLLWINYWVKKNLARLRGGNILTSCINAQRIMISSLGKWTETLLLMHEPLRQSFKLREFKIDN